MKYFDNKGCPARAMHEMVRQEEEGKTLSDRLHHERMNDLHVMRNWYNRKEADAR